VKLLKVFQDAISQGNRGHIHPVLPCLTIQPKDFPRRAVTRTFAEVLGAQMRQHLAEDLQCQRAVLLPERPNEPAGRGVPQAKPWFGWLTR
jgi:hypothetical protein